MTVTTRPTGRGTTRPLARRGWLKHWREYVSISPFFVIFLLFGALPLAYGVVLSFQSWDGLSDARWVGVDQWERLFRSGDFWYAAGNTLLIFAMGQIPVIVGALVAAVVLSQPRLRGRSFYQTAFFLPQVTSLVVVAVVFQAVFSDRFGLANLVAKAVNLPTFDYMTNPWGVRLVIALMVIWRGFGYFLVIFMAGLSTIDTSLYEAARVDGAGAVRTFFSMTIPLLRPTISFVALTGTISGLQMFTEPQILFSGQSGPDNSGLTMMLLQYQYLGGPGGQIAWSPVRTDFGYAATIGWAIFLILLGIAAVNSRLLRRKDA